MHVFRLKQKAAATKAKSSKFKQLMDRSKGAGSRGDNPMAQAHSSIADDTALAVLRARKGHFVNGRFVGNTPGVHPGKSLPEVGKALPQAKVAKLADDDSFAALKARILKLERLVAVDLKEISDGIEMLEARSKQRLDA